MDLVWLVYGISLLRGIEGMLVTAIIISGFSIFGLMIYRATEGSQEDYYSEDTNAKKAEKAKWAMNHVKTTLIVFITSCVLMTLVPSEKTAYVMVGAYAAQKIAENDKVEQTGSKVLTIINQKLDQYVEEGIDAATKAAEKKVKGKHD